MKRLQRAAVFLLAAFSFSVSAMEPTLIYEEDGTLLTSTIQVVVLNGSSDDPPGKNGFTNLLAEMVLRGTKGKNRNAFQSEIERLGATLSVRTTQEMTVFVGRVIKENTDKFIKLLTEAMLKPAFSSKELESLRRETIGELSHMKNSNGRLSGLAMRREVFAGTMLERPVEGGIKSVKSITRDDILKGYKTLFNRGNFVFGMASPLKEAEVAAMLKPLWTGLPDGARRLRRSLPLKVPKEARLILVDKPKTSTGAIMFAQAGITARDEARYGLAVANFVFGGEPLISRLFRVIRSELGWTYAVGSTYHAAGSLGAQQGFYILSSTPTVEFSAKTILKILSMWREFMKAGLKPEELKLARESLINSYPFEFDSAEKRLWQRLHGYLYEVPVLSPEEYASKLNALDAKQILTLLNEKQTAGGWIISIVAEKAVIEKQLAEEQKEVPAEKRLTISKVYSPDELIQ